MKLLIVLVFVANLFLLGTPCNVYECDCMHIVFNHEILDDTSAERGTNENTCPDIRFTYYFNNTGDCKEISNVVFGTLHDLDYFDIGECITEVNHAHSPSCNETFENPVKFDFGDCFQLEFTVFNAKVINGVVQYKSSTECFHCHVPIPDTCEDDESPQQEARHSSANTLSNLFTFICS